MGIKLEKSTLIISTIAGFLGLVSIALSFAADRNTVKASEIHEIGPGVCSYPRSPAYALGISSAVFLLASHIVLTVASNYIICCRMRESFSPTSWIVAMFYSFLYWFTFASSFINLFRGVALNDKHSVEKANHLGRYFSYCYGGVSVTQRIFATAAFMCLINVTASILNYIYFSFGDLIISIIEGPDALNQIEGPDALNQIENALNQIENALNRIENALNQIENGIAMGQPQVHPIPHDDPVVVHQEIRI